MELGLRTFDVLDTAGKKIGTKWLNPAHFIPTPGEWLSASGSSGGGSSESSPVEFVRQAFGFGMGMTEPVLNSLGEPLIASAEGTLMNLEPVAANLASAGIPAGIDAIGAMFSIFRPQSSTPSEQTVIWNPRSGSVDVHSSSASSEGGSEDTGDQQNNDDVDENKSDHSETNEEKDQEDADDDQPENSEDKEDNSDGGEEHQTAETSAPETTTAPEATTAAETTAPTPNTATATQGTATSKVDTPHTSEIDAPEDLPTTSPAPTRAQETMTDTTHEKTCTHAGPYPYPDNYCPHTAKNVYPYPDKHTPTTPTTLSTVTTSNKPTLTGCQTNSECPVCIFPCQIGELPRECVRNARNIPYVHNSGKYTWDDCVKEIYKLDRAEAKAWANSITFSYCVSENEWEPKEFDKKNGGECWIDIRGHEFAKVKDVWITGMLPLKCPRYVEGSKNDPECGHAIDVLSKPWKGD